MTWPNDPNSGDAGRARARADRVPWNEPVRHRVSVSHVLRLFCYLCPRPLQLYASAKAGFDGVALQVDRETAEIFFVRIDLVAGDISSRLEPVSGT